MGMDGGRGFRVRYRLFGDLSSFNRSHLLVGGCLDRDELDGGLQSFVVASEAGVQEFCLHFSCAMQQLIEIAFVYNLRKCNYTGELKLSGNSI